MMKPLLVLFMVGLTFSFVCADDSQDALVVETLTRLNRFDLSKVKPATREAVLRHIDTQKATPKFIGLLEQFNIHDRNDVLFEMAIKDPDGSLGISAAKLLLKFDVWDMAKAAITQSEATESDAALRVFGSTQDKRVLELLVSIITDSTKPLPLRNTAVRSLGRGPTGEKLLFDLAVNKQLSEDVHLAAANVLLVSRDPAIRDEVAKHLSLPVGADSKPLPPLSTLAKMKGDAAKGKDVYLKATCIACHQVGGMGVDFGPSLSEIGSKLSGEALYESILNPSAGISFGFEAFLVTTQDGNQLLGYISSQTQDSISLKQMGGITTQLKQTDIKSMEKQPQSLMTPNLQLLMTQNELVDLVAYLATLKKPK